MPKEEASTKKALGRLGKIKSVSLNLKKYLGEENTLNISQAQTGSTYFIYNGPNGIEYKIRVSDHPTGQREVIDNQNGTKTITIYWDDPNPIQTLKNKLGVGDVPKENPEQVSDVAAEAAATVPVAKPFEEGKRTVLSHRGLQRSEERL